METALPSRSSLTSFVVVTAMLLAAAVCATPVRTTPFAPRLAELRANLETDIAVARVAQLERELDALQRKIDAHPIIWLR
jgi:hypothetical protein